MRWQLLLLLAVCLGSCSRAENENPALWSWSDYDDYNDYLLQPEIPSTGIDKTIYHLTLFISNDLSWIDGRAKIRVINSGPGDLDRLIFLLYPNLTPGNMSVQSISVARQESQVDIDPPQKLNYQLTVPLSPSLPSGAVAVVEIAYTVRVPRGQATMHGGFALKEDVLSLAYCYPMMVPPGPAPEQPSPRGDFTAGEVAFYRVHVELPENWIVAAPGKELSRYRANGRTRITIALGPARDFYLAASPHFQLNTTDSGPVQIRSYTIPEATVGAERILNTAKHGLEIFSSRFGDYPYSSLTLVSVPISALGLEFPAILLINTGLYPPGKTVAGMSSEILLESTTAHELAHQWFYGIVGTDQLEEPWIDESLAQYATWIYYNDRYGSGAGVLRSFKSRWDRVQKANIPLGMPVYRYTDKEYGAIIYGRGPLFLIRLAEVFDFDVFLKDLNTAFRWQMVTTDDFRNLAEKTCDCALTELFDTWVSPQSR